MGKSKFQKISRLIIALLIILYPFISLSNNLSSVKAGVTDGEEVRFLTFALGSGQGTVTTGGITLKFNDAAPINGESTFTAVPAPGYTFTSWKITNAEGQINDNPLTVGKPDTDITITAYFTPTNYNLTLNVDPSEGGVIKNEDGNAVEPGILSYNLGSEINFTAEPRSGYKFKNWSGNYTNNLDTGNVQFDMPSSDVTLTAVFEKENVGSKSETTSGSTSSDANFPKTSDDFNMYPYVMTLISSGALYFLLKVPVKKVSKRYKAY